MRYRTLFVSLVACGQVLLGLSSVFGQYPQYQWINPYQRDIPGTEVVFSQKFDASVSPEVQMSIVAHTNQCDIMPSRNGLHIVSHGDDPGFTTPSFKTHVNKKITGHLKLTITMQSSMGNCMQIFCKTSTSGSDFGAYREIYVPQDGKFHACTDTFEIDGDLLEMRIDPGTTTGTAVIQSIEIARIDLMPIEVTQLYSDQDQFEMEVTNRTNAPITVNIDILGSPSGANESQTQRIKANDKITVSARFPKKEPFERIAFHVTVPKVNGATCRAAYAFHPDANTVWVSLKNDRVECLFAENGSGAKILYDGKLVGILCPLLYEDNASPPVGKTIGISTTPKSSQAIPFPFGELPLVKEKADVHSMTLTIPKDQKNKPIKALTFALDDSELRFAHDSRVPLFGPVFRPLGQMEQAVLSGLEFLERGEHSSSKADIFTDEHVRFVPKPHQITLPFAGIITDQGSFGLLWDNPQKIRPIFATPDFLEGKQPGDVMQNRICLCGVATSGTLRIGAAYNTNNDDAIVGRETICDAIDWAVKKRGLPDLPLPPRTPEKQQQLYLAALTKSMLSKDGTWASVVVPGDPQPVHRNRGADFVSTIWHITGKLPEGSPLYDRGGAALENPAAFFLVGLTQHWLNQLNTAAENDRQTQLADGSFHYDSEGFHPAWGEHTKSGRSINRTASLFEHHRISGNKQSLSAALLGIDYINRERIPRGDTSAEISRHTPDLIACGLNCLSNVRAYEATGDKAYLKQARRWAVSGLPFVYQWSPQTSKSMVMRYATIAVYGASWGNSHNWMGRPVQWCGLQYADAMVTFAQYDTTLDWRKVAEGILLAGEQMQYTKGETIGLLPDSWLLETQTPQGPDINPCVLAHLRRRINGHPGALDVQVSGDKKYRVVSPFAVRLEENVAIIEGKDGTKYQILVNGHRVVEVESKGTDRVDLGLIQ